MSDYEDELFGEPLDLPEEGVSSGKKTLPKQPRQPRNWKKLLLIIAVGLTCLGIGFGAVRWYMERDDSATTEEEQSINEQTAIEEAALAEASDIPSQYQVETTRTSAPRLEITYPETWTLTEADGGVRLNSPAFSFTTLAGEEIEDGYFTIYMRQGARAEDSPYFGRGIASRNSTPLTYTDPALGQRESTNMSFFGIDNANHIAYLLVAGNFSLNAGDTLGPDYANEPEDYIIVGGYASSELGDDLATHPVQSQYFDSSEAYRQALEILSALKIL